jgi:hypothetical protein
MLEIGTRVRHIQEWLDRWDTPDIAGRILRVVDSPLPTLFEVKFDDGDVRFVHETWLREDDKATK